MNLERQETSKGRAFTMIGSMASGKTYIAKILAERAGLQYISPDMFRDPQEEWSKTRSIECWSKTYAIVYRCIKQGIDFILDTANHDRDSRNEFCETVKAWSHGKYSTYAIYVKNDLKTTIANNSKRERSEDKERVRQSYVAISNNPPKKNLDGFDNLVYIDNEKNNAKREELEELLSWNH